MRESRNMRSAFAAVAVSAAYFWNSQATRLPLPVALNRDGGFDRWMRVVTDQLKIFELKIPNVLDGGVQFHPRQRSTITRQLFVRLLEVISIKMQIAERVNKISRLQVAYLRDH